MDLVADPSVMALLYYLYGFYNGLSLNMFSYLLILFFCVTCIVTFVHCFYYAFCNLNIVDSDSYMNIQSYKM